VTEVKQQSPPVNGEALLSLSRFMAYSRTRVHEGIEVSTVAVLSSSRLRKNKQIGLVPRGGLEPPRPCGLRILSPLRLPISPSGHCRLGSWWHRT
jgi:hypothetical protein